MDRIEHGGNDMLDYKNPYREIPEINKLKGVTIHETHDNEPAGCGHSNKYIITKPYGTAGDNKQDIVLVVQNSWGVRGFMEGLWECSLYTHDDKNYINPIEFVSGLNEKGVLSWINKQLS